MKPGRIVTICGPGGMGKTALVAEVLWTLAPGDTPPPAFPDGIIFHSFYNQSKAAIALEQIARVFGEEPLPTPALAAQRALSGRRVLFVLDGAEEASDLEQILAVCADSAILVTSRRRDDAADPAYRHDLPQLPTDKAVAVVQALGGKRAADEAVIKQICEMIGGLPLSLRLVGRYLSLHEQDAIDYLHWLQEAILPALDQGGSEQQSVPKLLERSVAKLSPDGQQMLTVVGLLALAPFECNLVAQALDLSSGAANRALGELVNYGLVLRLDKIYEVSHPLIRTYAREALLTSYELTRQHYLAGQVVQVLTSLFPEVIYTNWPICERLLPHVLGCAPLIERYELESPEVARLLHRAGNYLYAHAQYTLTEVLYLHAIKIRRTLLGDSHPDVAQSLNALGELYQAIGDYPKAAQFYQQALEIRRTLLGDSHPDVAQSLNNLAELYRDMGDYTRAEPLYQQALKIRRTLLGDSHPDVAQNLNDLAKLYRAMGDYTRAEPLYQQALKIRHATLGEEHPDVAQSLNNLAELYRDMGDYTRAEPLYQQALKIRRATLGEEHPDVAQNLNDLAKLYRAMGDYTRAEALHRRALEIRRTLLGDSHPDVAQSLNNLAELYRDMGDYTRAEPLYQQALKIRRATLGEEHPDVAQSLNNLGQLYCDIGNDSLAEDLYRQAWEIRRRTLGEVHPNIAQSLKNLATVYTRTARASEALMLMEQAALIDNRLIWQMFSITSERQRTAYLRTFRKSFDSFLSLILQYFPHSMTAVQLGLDLVLRRKAIGVEASSLTQPNILSDRYPNQTPKLHELNTLRMQIAQKTLDGPGSESLEHYRQTLMEWNLYKERLEAELAGLLPEMNLDQQLQKVNWQAVVAALPQEAALIEFVRFNIFDFQAVPAKGETAWREAHYVAFVLLSSGNVPLVELVDLGEAGLIDQLIAAFRASITEGESEPGLKANGIALRGAIFDPLLTALGECRRLFLAPEGDLTTIPFEALPINHSQNLIDVYQISYLGTGRDVLRFGVSSTFHPSPALVITDPDFDLGGTIVRDNMRPPKWQSRGWGRNTLYFEPLPGTREEGLRIAALLNVQPVLGANAVKGWLKACHSPFILHIATHGWSVASHGPFFHTQKSNVGESLLEEAMERPDRLEWMLEQATENPMLGSALALAGINTWLRGGVVPPEAENGILTAEEASSLDLSNTELVVLSASNTGLGQVHVGEGVLGLRRAFILAGAKRIVMSLWSPSDKQTVELMVDFYRQILNGSSCADAFRNAQLGIKEKYRHPFYWAAFIFQGDPGPLFHYDWEQRPHPFR